MSSTIEDVNNQQRGGGLAPSVNEPRFDPDTGYARFSYDHEPPARPGFKVQHVKSHRRGNLVVPDRWFYLRVDKDGLAYRGRLARERMVADGIAPAHVLKRDSITPEEAKRQLEEHPSPGRKKLTGRKGLPGGKGIRRHRYRRTTAEMAAARKALGIPKGGRVPTQFELDQWSAVPAQIRTVATRPAVRASSAIAPGKPDSIWVPVRGAGELVHGWLDLAHGMFLRNDQLQPEGLQGTVRRDATLQFTENFQDVLAQLQKVK